jgi:muconolactone delta-isomerase
VELQHSPSYYDRTLANGKPIIDIAPTIEWGYLLYLTVFRLCQYFGAQEECQFCDINENYHQQKKAGKILEAYWIPGWGRVMSIGEAKSAEEIVQNMNEIPVSGFMNYEIYPLADYNESAKIMLERIKSLKNLTVLNDEAVFSARDPTFHAGQIGLVVSARKGPQTTVTFDDLIVRSLPRPPRLLPQNRRLLNHDRDVEAHAPHPSGAATHRSRFSATSSSSGSACRRNCFQASGFQNSSLSRGGTARPQARISEGQVRVLDCLLVVKRRRPGDVLPLARVVCACRHLMPIQEW